ncbi:carbohydrate ABC transporter permease [uncultured Amnibacterium sp.]|uniref:carbohydrate ABC transporter permease n=1 Tax=uncultured Amnibacterium sp. TaxID=1631851 RepID=UPI0035C9545D
MTTVDRPLPVAATRTASPRRRRARRGVLLRALVAIVVAVVTLFPLYWMVVVALSSRSDLVGGELRLIPTSITFENFAKVLNGFPVGTWFGNSVSIAVAVAVLTVAVNLLAGYAFAHLRFRGSSTLFLIALGTLTLPVQTIMVALFRLVTGLGLYGSYWAVVLPTAASAFGLFLARQFLLGIPRELIEAARIDGASHFRVFRSVVLPLSRPLIAVLFFMTLLSSWNDFAWPLIALKENSLFTLPIGLLYLQSENGPDYGSTMAFALIDVAPMVVLFLLFQRYFVQGFARSGIR